MSTLNKTLPATEHPQNVSYNANDPHTRSSDCPEDETAFTEVILTLTIPLWSFVTIYLLLLLIHYLRRIQHYKLYDRCTPKNAHFRYDFHSVIGKHSTNYTTQESHLILDLLDNQLVSTMTVQVPGTTIFNDCQVFTYNHSRPNMRCISFSIYRRHPIKDVRCIRLAHSCSNLDSRLFVYGVNFYDATNAENKFFPITSVVKYRGTQWALNTTFEPKNETNFAKMGCACYDPFGTTVWPTHMELLILFFYIWCSILCFGHLISVEALWNSVTLHAFTVGLIAASSATFIGLIYIRLIKTHIVDQHYESILWLVVKCCAISALVIISIVYWSLATGQINRCKQQSIDWMVSSISSATILTLIVGLSHILIRRKKMINDDISLQESDNILMKTNSKKNIEFAKDTTVFNILFHKAQPNPTTQQQSNQLQAAKDGMKSGGKKTGSDGSANAKQNDTGRKGSIKKKSIDRRQKNENKVANEETLDNAFENSDAAYMKTKNRNSISQYV